MSEERDLMEAQFPDNGGGISVAGMVIGIVAAVFAHIPFLCALGLLLSIPAIICASKGRKRAARNKQGIAVTGLVLGWVAFGMSIFMSLYTGLFAYVFLRATGDGSLEEWIHRTYLL
ncbi:MAG: DUF4190 domain-containing protein [Clostridiales bacterium]|nr:DUF4190 domain-containing protein [Clostridiales bacterium]OPZ69697.1 MAG: hypothetical protein BWY81_00308 [Firmicutes bacterium ADurb.Bin467]